MGRLTALFSVFMFIVTPIGMGKMVQALEKYPVKPINIIVPVEAGADGDVMTRQLCQKASTLLGQPIIIVNKPGAGSSIGYREIYAAKPNGYTIGMATGTIITNKLQGIMPYDYHDYTMVGVFYDLNAILIASTKTQRPFKTFKEVISFAKSHPGEVSIATSGVGQAHWFFTLAFQETTKLKFNILPQPGAAGFAVAQVAGGHADLGILGLPAAKPQIDAGNVRFLAVFGSRRAVAPYENVPSLKEFGYDITIVSTGSILGPPKMPKDVSDRLVKAFETAITDPEFQKFLTDRYVIPIYLSPDQAIKYLDAQRKDYRIIAEKAGILKEK